MFYSSYHFLFQFTHWVDAVIFVFSLENEMSFNAIYSYYAKMAHYRNTAEVPLILVGTQGKTWPHCISFIWAFLYFCQVLNQVLIPWVGCLFRPVVNDVAFASLHRFHKWEQPSSDWRHPS